VKNVSTNPHTAVLFRSDEVMNRNRNYNSVDPAHPSGQSGYFPERSQPHPPGAKPKAYKYASAQARHRTCAGQGRCNRRAAPGGLTEAIINSQKKSPVNVVCMLLLQFPGNPLYILFFYLFLFFRKHKQNRKRNIVIKKNEYQRIFLNTTVFNVG
jgi:hypothetical protein